MGPKPLQLAVLMAGGIALLALGFVAGGLAAITVGVASAILGR
jgi:hypothetical protein